MTAQSGLSSPSPIATGVVRGGTVDLHKVPGTDQYSAVLATTDSRHVTADHGWNWDGAELRSVDVVTGRAKTLSRFKVPTVIAQNAVTAPHIVAAEGPQRPWNGRALTLGLLAVLVAGATVLVRSLRVRR